MPLKDLLLLLIRLPKDRIRPCRVDDLRLLQTVTTRGSKGRRGQYDIRLYYIIYYMIDSHMNYNE